MAGSVRFAPGKAIRWRKRRFVVVDCAALDTIIVREVGKRGIERIRPASQSQIMCLVQSHTICGKSRPVAFNLPIDRSANALASASSLSAWTPCRRPANSS
jgi:transcriptional regulator of met regulon